MSVELCRYRMKVVNVAAMYAELQDNFCSIASCNHTTKYNIMMVIHIQDIFCPSYNKSGITPRIIDQKLVVNFFGGISKTYLKSNK